MDGLFPFLGRLKKAYFQVREQLLLSGSVTLF